MTNILSPVLPLINLLSYLLLYVIPPSLRHSVPMHVLKSSTTQSTQDETTIHLEIIHYVVRNIETCYLATVAHG